MLRNCKIVSTHSRPKAAGSPCRTTPNASRCFNTQPPEGGWSRYRRLSERIEWFQHTAARRRLGRFCMASSTAKCCFNTQPPEGGWIRVMRGRSACLSFNTQPPEGGWNRPQETARNRFLFQHTAARRRLDHNSGNGFGHNDVSTHSRPKAAGAHARHAACGLGVSTHSRPKAAGACLRPPRRQNLFQHTAARRRLGPRPLGRLLADAVSTHSRPKAAGRRCFNTQPPEGGWRGIWLRRR